jgi:hypothetical protein
MSAKILTANRLADGLVVYLTETDRWTEAISSATVARDTGAEQRLLAFGARSVAARHVVDAYLIDVADAGPVRPLRFREAIRANGPTVETPRDAAAPQR